MIDRHAALAVMGNHEFNAIAYHTKVPGTDNYFREHTDKNRGQHEETLNQLAPEELSEFIEWFRTLPVAIDLDGLRVVHASWDREAIDIINEGLAQYGGFSAEFLREATNNDRPTKLFQAVEDVLKGKEADLPSGMHFFDKDDHKRHRVRIRWYESPEGKTIRDYALPSEKHVPTDLIPAGSMTTKPYPRTDPPVFFGHYWLEETRPSILAANVACLDYSVAKGGFLCAYCWSGEQELSNDNFDWIGKPAT